jgi:hypothetical protein
MCLKDYETVNHLMLHCKRFETVRCRLTDALDTALDAQLGTFAQDLGALKKWRAMKCCLDVLESLGILI